jgi:polysaccharide biosynthesis PFTS motif protein
MVFIKSKKKYFSFMRGYRILKNAGDISRIKNVEQSLLETKIIPENFSPLINRRYFLISSDKVLREYLFYRLINSKFRIALLSSVYSNSSILYPLPSAWRKVLEEKGFRVAKYRSKILWTSYLLLMLCAGMLQFIKVFYRNFFIAENENFLIPYVSFFGLKFNNIPNKGSRFRSYTIINWWLNWPRRNKNVCKIIHSESDSFPITVNKVAIVGKKDLFPKLKGVPLFLEYTYKSIYIIFSAIINFFLGSWYYIFILEQFADLLNIELVDPKKLAREYFFHNSNLHFRPLWTYIAETNGSKVWMYFYSTNFYWMNYYAKKPTEFIQSKVSKSSEARSPYNFLSWTHFLVWDRYQENFLRTNLGSAIKCKIVGPIWFNDSNIKIGKIPDNSVFIFDVEPPRNLINQSYCYEIDYYSSNNLQRFIQDIYDVSGLHNLNLVLKGKRDIGLNSSKSYRSFLNSLSKRGNFTIIDSNISPFRLLNKASLVISYPYTSTAIIAKSYGLTSIYYDPTNSLKKPNIFSHGIPVISGKNELIFWFESYHNKINNNNNNN